MAAQSRDLNKPAIAVEVDPFSPVEPIRLRARRSRPLKVTLPIWREVSTSDDGLFVTRADGHVTVRDGEVTDATVLNGDGSHKRARRREHAG